MLKELHRYNGSRFVAVDLRRSDARKSYKSSRQDCFLERRTKVRLRSQSDLVKSSKDESPADGGSICHGRKIFC